MIDGPFVVAVNDDDDDDEFSLYLFVSSTTTQSDLFTLGGFSYSILFNFSLC